MPNSSKINPPSVPDSAIEGHPAPVVIRLKALRRFLLVYLIIVGALLVFLPVGLSIVKIVDGNLVEKEAIKSQLVKTIKSGGNLDILKHIYSRRESSDRFFIMKKDIGKYYSYETSFSVVLNDLLSDYLSAEPFKPDSVFHNRILSIISENSFRNPFDNLEESQRYYFENIRIKSESDYAIISADINNIASELQERNELVTRYLSKSSASYVISIIALILTAVASSVQIILALKSLRGNSADETKTKREEL